MRRLLARRFPPLLWLATLLALLSSVPAARAQLSVRQATAMLQSADADEVLMGFEALGASGARQAVAPIRARIEAGLPDEILLTAVQALGMIGHASASPILVELLSHRDAGIRAASADALGAMGASSAADLADPLLRALGDQEANVRASAANALANLNVRSASDRLLLAFERGVPEAAMAYAQLTDSAGASRFFNYLGRKPLDELRSAFDEILARRDIERGTKLDFVRRLAELATPEVGQYLAEIAAETDDPELRQAAQDAAQLLGAA